MKGSRPPPRGQRLRSGRGGSITENNPLITPGHQRRSIDAIGQLNEETQLQTREK